MERAQPDADQSKSQIFRDPNSFAWLSQPGSNPSLNPYDFSLPDNGFPFPDFGANNVGAPTLSADLDQSHHHGTMFSGSYPTTSSQQMRRPNGQVHSQSPHPVQTVEKSSPNETPRLTLTQPTQSEQDVPPQAVSVTRAGLNPAARAHINHVQVPSLEDKDREQEINQHNIKVREWLDEKVDDAYSSGNKGQDETNFDAGVKSSGPHVDAQASSNWAPFPVREERKYLQLDEPENDQESEFTFSDVATDATPPAPFASSSRQQTNQNGQEPSADTPQVTSSNAAIQAFNRMAKDTDNASLTATIGSERTRRYSDSIISISGQPSRAPTASSNQGRDPALPSSRLLEMIRRPSHSKKVRETNYPKPGSEAKNVAKRDHETSFSCAIKATGWPRPRSPKLDTSPEAQQSSRPTHNQSLSPITPSGPWNYAKDALRRARSKSDLSLTEMIARKGGPPVVSLKSSHSQTSVVGPIDDTDQPRESNQAKSEHDHVASDAITVDLSIKQSPSDPTPEGLQDHIKRLNPRLPMYMVKRVTQEQSVRYKRLVDARMRHRKNVNRQQCPSKARCHETGEGPFYPALGAGARGKENAPMVFQVSDENETLETRQAYDEGTMEPAVFPEGIPRPPVVRLPALFECPLCYQVKTFNKPSDWTKHVHEDVQPFTCTFPECGEPKSFKRKADWVRHENERHRHLEKWICDIGECRHECYRKDNFVQHLVREHKYPEPRVRSTKAADKGYPAGTEENGMVAEIVDKCHHETTQRAEEEPCRFCGYLCNSWKKLTVHLAKHMEQISLPVLTLLDQSKPSANSDGAYSGIKVETNSLSPGNVNQGLSSSSNLPLAPEHHENDDFSAAFVGPNTTSGGATYPPATLQNYPMEMNTVTHPGWPPFNAGFNGVHSDTSVYATSDASTSHNPFDVRSQPSNTPSPYSRNVQPFGNHNLHPYQNIGMNHTSPSPSTYPPTGAFTPPRVPLVQSQQQAVLQDPVLSASPDAESGAFSGYPATTGFEQSIGALSLDQTSVWPQSQHIPYPAGTDSGFDMQGHCSSGPQPDIGFDQHSASYPPISNDTLFSQSYSGPGPHPSMQHMQHQHPQQQQQQQYGYYYNQ